MKKSFSDVGSSDKFDRADWYDDMDVLAASNFKLAAEVLLSAAKQTPSSDPRRNRRIVYAAFLFASATGTLRTAGRSCQRGSYVRAGRLSPEQIATMTGLSTWVATEACSLLASNGVLIKDCQEYVVCPSIDEIEEIIEAYADYALGNVGSGTTN